MVRLWYDSASWHFGNCRELPPLQKKRRREKRLEADSILREMISMIDAIYHPVQHFSCSPLSLSWYCRFPHNLNHGGMESKQESLQPFCAMFSFLCDANLCVFYNTHCVSHTLRIMTFLFFGFHLFRHLSINLSIKCEHDCQLNLGSALFFLIVFILSCIGGC